MSRRLIARVKRWARDGVAVPFALGVSVAAFVHSWTGWWLNSGDGVAWMVLMLFSIAGSLAYSRGWRYDGAAVWSGAMAALVGRLMYVGPGTLWPIVIVVTGVISACAISAGGAVGRWFSVRMQAR